jgi:hypothetical protein
MAFAGCNSITFEKMLDACHVNPNVPCLNPTGYRYYLNELKFPGPVPAKWPTIPNVPDSSAHAAVSIRPDLTELLKGNLDDALITFMQSAPAGPTSLLGMWHEASTGGPDGVYNGLITPAQLVAAQTHVQKLAHNPKNKINVKVGAIEVVGISAKKVPMYMAPGLDFYSCDIYDNKEGTAKPYEMLGTFRTLCDDLNSKHGFGPAVIGVTEANSRMSKRRPFWFHTIWSWLQTRGFTSNTSCFLTFWRTHATESGAWDNADVATIDTLNTIFNESKP